MQDSTSNRQEQAQAGLAQAEPGAADLAQASLNTAGPARTEAVEADLTRAVEEARSAGWDEKKQTLDVDAALSAINAYIEGLPANERSKAAADIYTERKRQIAARLESGMTMPSYTSSKQIHETMYLWLAFLRDMPSLNPELIKNEVNLCSNLCLRSRNSIMPGDRIVYTAFATHNNKETYGETFARELSPRIDKKKRKLAKKLESEKERISRLAAQVEAGTADPSQIVIGKEREKAASLTNLPQLTEQLSELEAKYAATKPYKLSHRHQVSQQIKATRAEIDSAEKQVDDMLAPLQEALAKRRGAEGSER